MLEAITDSAPSILVALRTIHGLQEEMLKVEILEALRLGARLRKDQLQFVAGAQDEIASSFRADAHPVDTTWRREGAVRFDRDIEFKLVEFSNYVLIELEQRLAAGANHEAAGEG